MSVALVRYDAACHAIAEAKAVDEVKQIRDVAIAMRAYAKQAKNRQLEIDAAEIRMRAERRVGELIAAQRETVGLSEGGRPLKTGGNNPPVSTLPTLAQAGIDKDLAKRARALANVPELQFNAMIGEWRERIATENERVTTNLIREGEREQTRQARRAPELPAGRYRLLYADPPWRYEHIETESRAIENQYPTMSLDEICALEVPAADDAVLYLWATSPKLTEAKQVIEAWDFNYRTCAVWDKELIGMGYYFRQGELQIGEFLQWIANGNGQVEVKRKRILDLHFYVETHCDKGRRGEYQPSGISVSTAQAWAFVLDDTGLSVVFPTELLRTMLDDPSTRDKQELDGNCPTKGKLISLMVLLYREKQRRKANTAPPTPAAPVQPNVATPVERELSVDDIPWD